MTDADLMDAENQAKALMRDAAGNAVLRESVEDWKREAAKLKDEIAASRADFNRAIYALTNWDTSLGPMTWDEAVAAVRALPPKERP